MTKGWKIALGVGAGLLVVRSVTISVIDQRMFRLGNTTKDKIILKQAIAYFEGRKQPTAVAMLKARLEELESKTVVKLVPNES